MRVKHTAEGTYTLICDEGELSLIAEGLYAVQVTGQRCLDRGIPDEFDAPVSTAAQSRSYWGRSTSNFDAEMELSE